MGVAFDEHQFFDQAQKVQPPSTKKNNSAHLPKRLEKLKILEAVNTTIKGYDPKRYRFLEALINDFQDGGKSVNYVCFLYDYFQIVPSDAWPRKEEILERLSPHLPKIPPAKKNNSTHLRKRLEKLKILEAVNTTIKGHDPKRYRFLEALINDFQDGGKSVNYVCFLYDYFQVVPSDAWPRKEEILERLSLRLSKIWKTRWRAKERFSEWWKETNPR